MKVDLTEKISLERKRELQALLAEVVVLPSDLEEAIWLFEECDIFGSLEFSEADLALLRQEFLRPFISQ